jgi:hypothetical protein
MNAPVTRALPMLITALLATGLVACGGAEPEGPGALGAPVPTTAQGRAAPLAVPSVTPPLLDDDGNLMPTAGSALPADPGARTRHGRYATPQQARQLEDALGVLVIPVNVEPGPDGAGAVELAQQMVWGHQAAHDLSPDAPVLVRGSDLRLGAAVVHQLEAAGYTRVLLVTH